MIHGVTCICWAHAVIVHTIEYRSILEYVLLKIKTWWTGCINLANVSSNTSSVFLDEANDGNKGDFLMITRWKCKNIWFKSRARDLFNQIESLCKCWNTGNFGTKLIQVRQSFIFGNICSMMWLLVHSIIFFSFYIVLLLTCYVVWLCCIWLKSRLQDYTQADKRTGK